MVAEFKDPKCTVDAVVIEVDQILLIKRKNDPFKDYWALPGGFINYGEETLEEAAIRELKEETSISATEISFIGNYSDPGRDPRGHTISHVYRIKQWTGVPKAADDAKELQWFFLNNLPKLAFDHNKILKSFVDEAPTKKIEINGQIVQANVVDSDNEMFTEKAINEAIEEYNKRDSKPITLEFRKNNFLPVGEVEELDPSGFMSKANICNPEIIDILKEEHNLYFGIGGEIEDSKSNKTVKSKKTKTHRIIKKFKLTEVSIISNPTDESLPPITIKEK